MKEMKGSLGSLVGLWLRYFKQKQNPFLEGVRGGGGSQGSYQRRTTYGAAHLVTDCLGQWPIWWEKNFDMLEGPNTRVRIGDQT